MLTVAYLANRFPAAVEPYVGDEIRELRRRGVQVIPGSVRTPDSKDFSAINASSDQETLRLWPIRMKVILKALLLTIRHGARITGILSRIGAMSSFARSVSSSDGCGGAKPFSVLMSSSVAILCFS